MDRNLKNCLVASAALLGLLVLACGPAAQGPGEPAGIEPPPPAPDATPIVLTGVHDQFPVPTHGPTKTPYPTDFVKPAEKPAGPAETPLPTIGLPPDPTPSGGATGASEPSLTDQVTSVVRDEPYAYDVIVRVRPLSFRTPPVAENVEWLEHPPYYGADGAAIPWLRTKIEVLETLHGDALPANYEVMIPNLMPNASLETGQEYILFIYQFVVGENDFPDRSGRHRFNETQLTAFGGKGGYLLADQFWVIEGETTWRVPLDHSVDPENEGSDLAAAKASGESLSVADLKAAIRAGTDSK